MPAIPAHAASISARVCRALKKSNLPYHAYELNAALVRALDTANAERAWLNGDDVFRDVMRDPGEIFDNRQANMMFQFAFRSE